MCACSLQKLILNMNRDQNIDHEECPHPESHIEAMLWHAVPWAEAQEIRRRPSMFSFLKYLRLFDCTLCIIHFILELHNYM